MIYNIVGTISSMLFIGCLWGLYEQIKKIKNRQEESSNLGYATQSMSVNGFFSSFIAFYSFFLYSFFLENVDYFIFWTRLLASLVTLYILFQIYNDRKSLREKSPFVISFIAIILSFVILFFREESMNIGRDTSIIIILTSTVIMLQGGISQVLTIFKQKCTGALSIRMNILFCLKDIMNILFGLVIGINDGWPLILMGSVSALLKLSIILQFYIYPVKYIRPHSVVNNVDLH